MDNTMLSILPYDLIAEASVIRQSAHRRPRPNMDLIASGIPRYNHMLRQVSSGPIPGQNEMASGRRTTGTRWHELNTEKSVKPGRLLLDHESLSSLLVLLFINEPRMIWQRLHRVFRNLSYHVPTRHWIIQSLLSILHRTGKVTEETGSIQISLSWLSITLEAALGCRTNVFSVYCNDKNKYTVTVNPQAAQIVCSHVLECLISLSRSFTTHFLPDLQKNKPKNIETDFWDHLVHLDLTSPMHFNKKHINIIPSINLIKTTNKPTLIQVI